MEEINLEVLNQLKTLFDMYDIMKIGSIHKKDVNELMKNIFYDNFGEMEKMNEINKEIETEYKDVIKFEELVCVLYRKEFFKSLILNNNNISNKISIKSKLKDDILYSFRVFDYKNNFRDKLNKICIDDLTNIISQIDQSFNIQILEEILEDFEVDEDGFFNYVELIEKVFE